MQSEELTATSLLGHTVQQYKLDALIASGGMGHLYRVVALKAPIQPTYRAMKLLPPSTQVNRSTIERFLREGRILDLLEHPNIVDLRGCGYDKNRGHYMVMEYLEGKTLKQHSKNRHDPFPASKIISWMQQLCQALHFCHHKSIIHRDIKPANIFLHAPKGEEETVKLLDFGIAYSPTEPDKQGERVGTPRYMAPEQVLRQPVTRQTDLYSLGVVLFELLTRRVMFEETDSELLRQAHLEKQPPRLGKVRPDVIYSEELEAFMQTILSKDPTQRPTSAPALFQQLSNILTTQPPKKKEGSLGIVIQDQHANPFFDADAPTPPRDIKTPQDPLEAVLETDPLASWEEHHIQKNNQEDDEPSLPSSKLPLVIIFVCVGLSVLGALSWFLWTLL